MLVIVADVGKDFPSACLDILILKNSGRYLDSDLCFSGNLLLVLLISSD